MDFRGRYLIPAPPDAVWAALHDPDILASCIPGCDGVTRLSDTDYRAQATVKIGPVRARFTGKVTWAQRPAPDGFAHAGVLSGEGQGGPAGFARGESHILLAPDGESTLLTYDTKAVIGGKLAQIGQRLIDATAKSMSDQFFAKFDALMRAGGKAAGAKAAPAQPPRRRPAEVGLKPQIWLAGIIGIVIVLLILFGLVLGR